MRILPMNLTGQTFHKLTAIEKVGKKWKCRCICGAIRMVSCGNLRFGHAKSCGCDRQRTKMREYGIWKTMINRCNRPQVREYKHYGGRGIKVCQRWIDSFDNFIADMGVAPGPKFSLDRYPNIDGHYEPKNVRWATPKQQGGNKRNSTWLVYKGERMILQDVSIEMRILPSTLAAYLKKYSMEDAISHFADRPYKQRGAINYLKLNQ